MAHRQRRLLRRSRAGPFVVAHERAYAINRPDAGLAPLSNQVVDKIRIADRCMAKTGRAQACSALKSLNFLDEGANRRMDLHKQETTGFFLAVKQDGSHFHKTELSSYKGVMDVVRKLIEQRVKELELNYADISRRLDRNVTYLQQFLKKGSPRELPERERILLAEILKVPEDELRGPSTLLPKRIYDKKPSQSRQSVVAENARLAYPQSTRSSQHGNIVPHSELFGIGPDLPVFGTSLGAHGAWVMTRAAVNLVARPSVLMHVQGGYGLIVTGDTMSPEHKPGSIALVNPHLPPRVGDSCVFRSDGTDQAILKEYRGETPTHWKVRQHNPPQDFTLKKSEFEHCHKTVGSYFL